VTFAAVIVDTNVVVAGLLTADSASPVALIVDGILRAAFPFVVSEVLLAEYRTVLLRPGVRRLHGLSDSEVDGILTDLARHAIVLAPATSESTAVAPDPGDQSLWNLLAARSDLVLITGDKLLLRHRATRGRMISPREFVDSTRSGSKSE
jgi:putative PIN family toxin of toxin-antitoxin system